MGSPLRSRHDPFSLSSSSPGLPSLAQIGSQVPRRPPLRSGSAAMPIPDDANHDFTSAAGFFREEQSAIDLTTPYRPPVETLSLPPEEDVTVISIAMATKPKRKRGVKVLELKAPGPPPNSAMDTQASQPWKQFLKPKDGEDEMEKKGKAAKAKTSTKKSKTVSRHFAKPKGKGKNKDEEAEIPPPPKKDADELLDLESAIRRRMDWTPPPADTRASASTASQAVDLLSLTAKSPSCVASKESFDNLFETFGRAEDELARPSVELPEGDNQVFKKRKLIETVSINDSAKTAASEKGLTQAKAPKKKARTITELATSAYVIPDATEQEEPSAVPLESVEGDGETTKGKGKKRASRAKKPKKAPPPEPVLLSPTAALRQAAKQDYVFGTSSQLAREQSPTFLRDLQSALQASNSLARDDGAFVTPINSDAIEPEPRQKLWAVGARDEDGRVLDLEVINLVDTPQAVADDGPNPFGYAGAEKPAAPLQEHFPSDDSFPDIDDLLAKEMVVDVPGEQKEVPPSASTVQPVLTQQVSRQASLPAEDVSILLNAVDDMEEDDTDLPPARLLSEGPAKVTSEPAAKAKPGLEPKKPNFDLYTDTQLAREISTYGFKPVKRRQAMLALLDQCWSSKQRTVLSPLPINHSISTTSQAQAAAKSQRAASVVSPKRRPGRPRKNSLVEVSSSEPPPSAQPPPPSPKRSLGRPRKNSLLELSSSQSPPSPKRPRGRPRKNSLLELSSSQSPPSPKRPRGRPRKNSLLELSSSQPPPSAQPPTPSPKRPRGRPRKAAEPTGTTGAAGATSDTIEEKGKSKASAAIAAMPEVASPAKTPRGRKPNAKSQEVIEIPDSASEGSLSSSPSRYSSPERTFSSPPPVDVSVGEDTEMSLAASPTSQQSATLFSRITEAVTTAPPTTDPSKPSFHEMMLMYDPIVLEDLAAWLNTGQLSRVGYDGEVSPSEVKQWCESKSVCCLWRENLRGGARKRY